MSLAALAAIFCQPTVAQTSDAVPGWALQAVTDLQREGLLKGYPDGSLWGRRTATRYEMAVMAYDVWRAYFAKVEGLRVPEDNHDERANLGAEIAEVRGELAKVRGLEGDLKQLKRLMVEFEPELTQMGLDYEQMRRTLGDLAPRVSWLEAHKLPFKVSGDLSVLMFGGDSGGGNYGFDTRGRPIGFGHGGLNGVPQNSTRDLTVLQEFALRFESVGDARTHWKGTLVTGNTLGALGQGSTLSGKPYTEGTSATYFQDLSVDWKGWRGMRGEAGRIGHVGNPYLLSRPQTAPQFTNARWSNPEWMLDGVKAQLPVGDGFLTTYGGRTGALNSVGGPAIQAMSFGRTTLPWRAGAARPVGILPGAMQVDSLYGADLDVPAGKVAISLNYEYLLGNPNPGSRADNGRAFGGSLTTEDGPFKLTGGYAKTDLLRGGTNLITRRNQAAWLSAKFKKKGLAAELGYRYIEPLFGGAGDWQRIGMWWNPTDLKGFHAKLKTQIGPNLNLLAMGGLHTGTGLTVQGQTGLGTDDHLDNLGLGLERRFGEWSATATVESVSWDLKDRAGYSGGRPVERWYGLDIRRESEHSLVSLGWLLSDLDSKGVAGYQLGIGPKSRGSLLTAQATLKF